MNFELWSVWHILYICSSFMVFTPVYFLMKNRSERAKTVLGCVLGSISILILVVRNVDIFVRAGWDPEVIPLQVCHIGSLIAGSALLFRKNWLILTAFCFNMIPAFLAMVFADALVNYDTLFKIRPQTYIWGHILIIVCALYAVLIYRPKLLRKDLYASLGFVGGMALLAIVCNSLFRTLFAWEPNYFYLFDYQGTPLKFLYQVMPSSVYGWFEINWFYVMTLLLVFVVVFIGMYYLARCISGRDSEQKCAVNEIGS